MTSWRKAGGKEEMKKSTAWDAVQAWHIISAPGSRFRREPRRGLHSGAGPLPLRRSRQRQHPQEPAGGFPLLEEVAQ